LATLAAPGVAEPVPAAISTFYDDLRIAIQMADLDALLNRLSPVAKVEANLGSAWMGRVAAIIQDHEALKAEVKLDEVKVVGDKALVLSTWSLTGKTKDTGEAWNTTLKECDLLDRRGGNWELTLLHPLDEAGATKVTEGVYQEPKAGLEATAPPKWRMLALGGNRASALAVSPDLAATVTWLVTDLPGTFTTEQIARSNQEALNKLLPAVGVTAKDVSFGLATLAGRPSFQSQQVFVASGVPEYFAQSNMCVAGSTLYAVGVSVFPAQALAGNRAGIARAVASTKITEPQPAALPAGAGQVEGTKYVNKTHGCEIAAPEGWDTKVEQGQFKLQVSMREPGGASAISLGMIELPIASLTAEQAVNGEDAVCEKAFEQFRMIRQGATKVGDLPAYESVTQFSMAGQLRTRWRIYLVDGNRLFFLFAEAAPADGWGRLEPVFRKTFQSFRLIEATGG
jgi:ketosteroid isomerase-like protein